MVNIPFGGTNPIGQRIDFGAAEVVTTLGHMLSIVVNSMLSVLWNAEVLLAYLC